MVDNFRFTVHPTDVDSVPIIPAPVLLLNVGGPVPNIVAPLNSIVRFSPFVPPDFPAHYVSSPPKRLLPELPTTRISVKEARPTNEFWYA
jgi:hypothetical protein